MSSCLYEGGQTTYGIDLHIIKSPSTSAQTTRSSSPSSTISESSNSHLAISTRKPRTPRKRPNQTYNEAAALLSTAYPSIFSTDDSSKPCKFIKPNEYSSFSFEESSSELLMPFPVEKQAPLLDPTAYDKPCSIQIEETSCYANSSNLCEGYEDFDTESILDEEIEEGVIDSIMGNLSACPKEEHSTCDNNGGRPVNFCYGYPIGLGLWFGGRFDFTFDGMRGGMVNAIRQNDGDWWAFPTVNVGEISPRFDKVASPQKKKVVEKLVPEPPSSASSKENTVSNKSISTSSKENSVQTTNSNAGLLLKLNYDGVLNAWSDRGSPFSEDIEGSEFSGSDALEKLAQIDLFGESEAIRESSVQRYKEKRRTRLFSKKIRYEVRKVNADQRPRMKGRFVRSNSSGS